MGGLDARNPDDTTSLELSTELLGQVGHLVERRRALPVDGLPNLTRPVRTIQDTRKQLLQLGLAEPQNIEAPIAGDGRWWSWAEE